MILLLLFCWHPSSLCEPIYDSLFSSNFFICWCACVTVVQFIRLYAESIAQYPLSMRYALKSHRWRGYSRSTYFRIVATPTTYSLWLASDHRHCSLGMALGHLASNETEALITLFITVDRDGDRSSVSQGLKDSFAKYASWPKTRCEQSPSPYT